MDTVSGRQTLVEPAWHFLCELMTCPIKPPSTLRSNQHAVCAVCSFHTDGAVHMVPKAGCLMYGPVEICVLCAHFRYLGSLHTDVSGFTWKTGLISEIYEVAW